MTTKFQPSRYLPILEWGKHYNRQLLTSDLVAAVIVTIMLIPQSLAYALLAGLPPEMGLYASILPLLAYACFGTSRTLAIGPVAIVSLMTAAAAGTVAEQGSITYITAAIALALLSGVFLLLMGIFRLGFIANFLSHPVISGFVSASAIIITASQLRHIFGVQTEGHNLYELLISLANSITDTNPTTLTIGVGSLLSLLLIRSYLKPLLLRCGLPEGITSTVVKAGPLLVVTISIITAMTLNLEKQGVNVVGDIPRGLPALAIPAFDLPLWNSLLNSALLISIIGFVESVSMAKTLAAKRRQRINPDQELIGLGASNITSSLSGGFPVTGGFSRSAVNHDAGAQTPAAGAITAAGIALATIFLTPLLYHLPVATLAATIIVAVFSLIDLRALRHSWHFSRVDFSASLVTIALTLLVGVEAGVMTGLGFSLALHLYRTTKPHIAVVGQVEGTEHFRNCLRHKVNLSERVISVRIDESLYFANAKFLEDTIEQLIEKSNEATDLILMCTAINDIDISALESLENINHQLAEQQIKFHLSEVKGPVMDKLKRSSFLNKLSGQVFLSQYEAFNTLSPKVS